MTSIPRGGARKLASWLFVSGLLIALASPAGAQTVQFAGASGGDVVPRQAGAAPALRIVEQTPRSITFEMTADWRGRLSDAIGPDLATTLVAATGGLPAVGEAVALTAPLAPQVSILASDYDEAPLAFSPDAAAEFGLIGPVAEVMEVGIERRRPAGTLMVRLLQADPETNSLRRYRRVLLRIDLPQAAAGGLPFDAQNPHLDVTESVLATGTWFKVPVTRGGLMRIDRAFLSSLNVNPANIDPNQVKVFGNGGRPVPALNSAPRIPDLVQNPVLVVGGGDGRFDEGDAVYFYAKPPNGWTWSSQLANSGQPGWRHFINPYSNVNYYFVRIDGPASQQVATAAAPAGTPNHVFERVTGRIFAEEDMPDGMIDRDGGGSGLDWLGRDLTRSRNRITVLDTLPPDFAGGQVEYRGRFALRSDASRQMAFARGEQILASATLPSSSASTLFQDRTLTFNETLNGSTPLRIDLRLLATAGSPTGWIDYIQAFYPQDLRASGDYLRFVTPGGYSGIMEFRLAGFSGAPHVWDVTHPGQTRALEVVPAGDTYRVRVRVEDPDQPLEIVAFRPQSNRVRALSGERAAAVPNQNLHGFGGATEHLIITDRAFWDQAQDLANYRTAQGLTSTVFDIQQIYNEFSGGLVDPRGMRDFIRFVYDRSPGPEPSLRYVLLLGDGSFDYRGIREGSMEVNFVPTYQTENSQSWSFSFTSDDYFALLAPNEGVWTTNNAPGRLDVGIGRIPVRTAQEAADAVEKIRRYESPETQGVWRTRYTLLSDDHLPNSWDRDLHVQNSEVVADSARALVPGLNFEKIYLSTYTLQQTALGARYPSATADAVRGLEEGTLVWNYSGHGGPSALSDARLITREEIRTLSNLERLTVAITATCSFGRFDLSGERSGGEEFVLNPVGGAIAIFTTTRVVYAGSIPGNNNLGLNLALNRYLMSLQEDGRPRRLGDIYRMSKGVFTDGGVNSRKFNLLGDPAVRFGLPERPVAITSINGIPLGDGADDVLLQREAPVREVASRAAVERQRGTLDDARAEREAVELAAPAGRSAGLPSFRALELATIRGQVQDLSGNFDPTFGGEVEVLVYDVERTYTLPPVVNLQHTDGTFQERSDLIYRGRASVTGGEWEAQFIVPRDVSYAGGPARVSAYVSSASGRDGQGFTEDVLIAAESGQPLNDTEGPRIRLFLNDTTFVSGGLSSERPVLIAKLSDESGINMAGVGVGHEMLLVINGNEAEAIDVGPFYRSDLDTFRRGSVRYQLPELDRGPHTLSLTAWDVVNNSSTATLDFVVEEGNRLRIEHAYPYPNPTTGPTRFVFEHNQVPGTPARVQIRIYTINGRPVRTLDGPETLPDGVLSGSPVQIPWDGRDEDFDELATGVYLYRVRVEVDQGDGERRVAERIERLAIIR